ncbi:hypothetical protein LSPCS325_30470 [Lysinibacillus sp. CTST325]
MSRFASLRVSGQQMFFARKRSGSSTDVGHEGIITGRDGFSLRSPIANPRGVAQSPLQSTYTHSIHFFEMSSSTFSKIYCCYI